jgi:MFS family permease
MQHATTPDGGGIPRSAKLAVLVAALGYLVDIYDLILFSVVRAPSLRALGVPDAQLMDTGSRLLDMQMLGMLIGGILWGVLGDKRGRLSVLFGSILMYSLANIANGFVTDVDTYGWLRLVAGIGLAGELGAGITLVTELLDARSRGWATTLVAGVGICGAVLAVLVSKVAPWYVAYWIGGGLGLLLLALRVGVLESGMFAKVHASEISRGNFLALFTDGRRALRYVAVVLSGVPIWYAIGILVTFSPEIGGGSPAMPARGWPADPGMGMVPAPSAAEAVMAAYIGLALGDFASGWLSQRLRSRKRALRAFMMLDVVAILSYFTLGRTSPAAFYACVFFLGIANGYWAVFVTVAAEQFGTNLRATATTSAPNFVRGSVPLFTFGFRALRVPLGLPGAALALGALAMAVAFLSLRGLEETYGKDLDFVES